MRRALGLLALALGGLVAPAEAQVLRVSGETGDPAAVRVRDIVRRGEYRVLDRDTLFPAGTVLAGDLVVVAADVRLEGSVSGSVAVLPGAELFVRPGGSVGGAAVAAGGGVFLSANATAGQRLELSAAVRSRVERAGEVYTLVLTPPAALPRFEPLGMGGLAVPRYDRVDGLTLGAGGLLRLRRDSAGPVLRATVEHRFARQEPGGELELEIPLPRRRYLLAEAGRTTESRDRWIRDDLINSVGALLFRSDARDYHEADWVALEAGREPPASLSDGEGFAAPALRLVASRARSLAARRVWTLRDGEERWRENPRIDPGTIIAAVPRLAFGWRGATTLLDGELELEWAPPGLGDFDFALLTADAAWSMQALWGHTITARARTSQPLGGAPPRQRWSIVGGPGTLPTLEAGELRGERLVYVESTYSVPLLEVVIPVAGSPSPFVRHAIGSAWSRDAADRRPPLEQNLGLGVAFRLVRASLDIDPSSPGRPAVSVAGTLPF